LKFEFSVRVETVSDEQNPMPNLVFWIFLLLLKLSC